MITNSQILKGIHKWLLVFKYSGTETLAPPQISVFCSKSYIIHNEQKQFSFQFLHRKLLKVDEYLYKKCMLYENI